MSVVAVSLAAAGALAGVVGVYGAIMLVEHRRFYGDAEEQEIPETEPVAA